MGQSAYQIAMKEMGKLIELANINQPIIDGINTQLADITINVKTFGAIGDGVADDTVSSQAAMDYIATLGGGRVYFPSGIYKISASITVPQNTIVYGAGMDLTSIVWSESDNTIATMLIYTRNTGTMRSAAIDLALNQKRSERGLLDDQSQGAIQPADHMDIKRVRIYNTVGPGITQAWITDVKIRDCEIYETGHHAIYFSTGNFNSVSDIEIVNNYIGTPAIFVGRLYEANLIKFRFSNSGDVIKNVLIQDNRLGAAINSFDIFISTTSGAQVCLAQNINIDNNKINLDHITTTGMDVGIYIGSFSRGDNVSITRNNIYSAGITNSYGIRLLFDDFSNCKNIVVRQNTIDNVEIGINSNISTVIENNVSYKLYGLTGITGKAQNNTFISSTNGAIGIRQAGYDCIENTIIFTGSPTTTIGIDMPNSTNLFLARNKITGAAQGILRNGKSLTGCVFSENVFVSCVANYVGFTNSAVTIQNNQFEHVVKDQSGATANRPTAVYVGQRYFDSTLNKPIWYNGTNWVDSTGTTV